ncbi:MAG TPA: molybdopterin-dependent oxidoreductase [Micromonosporaceae bacterium]|nr:molybdopterin-dependent oxidoreductase [Micromonosporaceae bacterium]
MTLPRRAGRRTNLALLLVLPAAFATGWLAFGTGTLWPARVVTTIHAALGIAVVLLVPWKRLIVRRGITRPRERRGWAVKACSVALAFFVLLSLVAGLAHAYAGQHTYLGVTAMQIHVGAAIAAVPFFAVHLVTRPQRVRGTDLSRRNALRLGVLAGAGALAYAALEGVAVVVRLPGRRRRATGSYETGTDDPDAMPQVIWLFDDVPAIEPAGYAVTVTAAGSSRRVGYADLAVGTDEVRAVIDCTGGWYATQTWRGVRLDRLLGGVPDGGVVVVTSTTGYRRRFPAAEASTLWLATHVAGRPLDPGHGAPARLVAPGRRGFWWVKWVATVAVEDGPSWWQSPFPLQ